MKPVGVLGGMGPEATILLMQKVLAAVPARDDADHIPLIVHQNPQVPSRIKALIDGDGTDPGPVLADMARGLERAGAQALAMPCNTAHHYAPVVERTSDLPFLNMLELTAAHLERVGAVRVGIMASPATRVVGVFDAAFARHGLSMVSPVDEAALLNIIRAVKSGEDLTPLRPQLHQIAVGLNEAGADHLLVACTELSLMTDALPDGIGRTDSLDCLVAEIVAFSTR